MIWTISLAVKSTLVLGSAAAAAWALRRSSASMRHALWVLALLGLAALPVLSSTLPPLELPLLPATRPAVVPLESVETGVTGVEATPAAGAAVPWSWQDWALLVWLTGSGLALVPLVTGSILVARAVRLGERVDDPRSLTLLEEAVSELGVRRRVELRMSDAASMPCVWGYRSPVILLPPASAAWPEERKRAILLHELAHVARHDLLTQKLAYVVRAFYWPHPLAWWAVSRLRRDAECACDDRVLHAGTPAPDYARHLLEAARGLPRPASLLTASAGAEGTRLGDRVRALLDERRGRQVPHWRSAALLGAGGLLAVAVLSAAEPVAAQNGSAPQDAAEELSELIVHQPYGCFVEGRFPEIDATVEPGFDVDEARLYFSSGKSDPEKEYWVRMTRDGRRLLGRLPAPRVAANPVHYRIEIRGTDARVASTERHLIVVVQEQSLCPEGARVAPGPSSTETITVHSSDRK